MFDWYDGNNPESTRYYPIYPIEETWLPVSNKFHEGIKPYYFVSDFGRIMSNSSGVLELLSPKITNKGYLSVNLRLYPEYSNYKYDRLYSLIHRLVLITFCDNYDKLPYWYNGIIPPLPYNYNKLFVNHKDSTPIHNWLWNLEWSTQKENIRHGILYGHIEQKDQYGEKNHMSILTENQVKEILSLYHSGECTNQRELSRRYNVNPSTIHGIIHGYRWTHINPIQVESRKAFTIDELHSICKFFEDNRDILNDKSIYPSISSICKDCLIKTSLINKYTLDSKRSSMEALLLKVSHQDIVSKYNYLYIK